MRLVSLYLSGPQKNGLRFLHVADNICIICNPLAPLYSTAPMEKTNTPHEAGLDPADLTRLKARLDELRHYL